MPIKFLYIDDERTVQIQPLITSLESASNNTLTLEHHQVMESISAVVSKLSQGEQYQGVIIDQQLVAMSEEGNRADYFGTTLAQHLRTEMALNSIAPLPLILLSNQRNIVESFEPDDSSKNLFDFVIKKQDLAVQDIRGKAVKVLTELVKAYEVANHYRRDVGVDLENQEVRAILKCDESTYEGIDSRFLDYVKSKAGDPHALVSAIYSTLVRSAGMLVTEQMLLTKLGIKADSQDWPRVKELFERFKYQGPFSELKERWWFSKVEDWWFDIHADDVLQALTCNERVEILKSELSLELLHPIEVTYLMGEQSQTLWVNCILSGTPLDSYDALRVRDVEAKPWEEPKYLDVKAFLNDESDTPKYIVLADDKPKIRRLMVRLKPDANT
ncbi:protein-PII uridylyltransferase [Vibrio splendidus]|uniref:protein-PII uridylyltransferase n=1 Tax=Vibrio splendidus TaxID=29497 RepID=UPI000C839ABD|nr:protein-PII uridylyltransferase [Vibrio splendidus]PMK16017.1 hypothetical protein BCU08_00615 [Vibrio splendidus]